MSNAGYQAWEWAMVQTARIPSWVIVVALSTFVTLVAAFGMQEGNARKDDAAAKAREALIRLIDERIEAKMQQAQTGPTNATRAR